jgi:hypothetical protein
MSFPIKGTQCDQIIGTSSFKISSSYDVRLSTLSRFSKHSNYNFHVPTYVASFMNLLEQFFILELL